MGDWDFLYGLEGQELEDAMATGATSWEWDMIARQEAHEEREKRQSEQKSAQKKHRKHKNNS